MGINWQQRDSVFRVLAAAYGELGEDVFRGHYRNIAKRFGPDATYDAIKNFFAREVTRAVQQYERQNAGKVPSLGASHGPTDFLLDDVEDDQDNLNEVSVLNDQQVAAFINGSDKSTTARRRLGLHQPPRDNPVQNGTLGARATALGSPPAPSCGQSAQKKRKYASVAPPAGEREPQPLIRNAPYVQPESFGFVTNQGEYRCALCMRKLVSQEALEQHEAMSKLHLRNLQNSMVVSTGRAKLVQATVVHQREDPSHLSPSPSAFLVSDQTAIAHEPRVPFPESSRYVGNGKSRARSISPPAPRKQQHGPAKEELYSEAPTPTVPGSNSVPSLQHIGISLMSYGKKIADFCESHPYTEAFGEASQELAAHNGPSRVEYVDSVHMPALRIDSGFTAINTAGSRYTNVATTGTEGRGRSGTLMKRRGEPQGGWIESDTIVVHID